MVNVVSPHKRRRLATPPPSTKADVGLCASVDPMTVGFASGGRADTKAGVGVGRGQTSGSLATAGSCCTSCRRALSAARTGIVICARCQRPSCGICSRRCTRSIPSYPPTPHLSFSPTPTPSPTIPLLRLALSTNTHTLNSEDTPRKRKISKGDQDDDEKSRENIYDGVTSNGKAKADEQDATHNDYDGGYSEGCGRMFCKTCCYEDRDAVTCLSCNGSGFTQ